MAIITDPDNLQDSVSDNGSTNVFIDTTNLTIKLNTGVGGLVAADGVTIKALYSFIKEEWKQDPNNKNLAAFDFPLVPITDEFFELVNGWTWANSTTEQTIRRGGWLVRNLAGGIIEHWVGTAILDSEADDQIYYDLDVGAVDYTFTGNTAEAIQVISDPNGDGNYTDGYNRSANVTVYNREQGQLFSSSSSLGIGESSLLAPKLFSFALPTGVDLNISVLDSGIDSNSDGTANIAPYNGMSIDFFTTPQTRDIGGVDKFFGIIIDGNSGTKQQIYEYVQWALRQDNDQDDGGGTLIGNVMPELLEFVGSTLKTVSAENYRGGGKGVYIDNFNAVDTNDIAFADNSGNEVTFPFVAAGKLLFNLNLINDTEAVYRVYFTDGVDAGLEFGESGAILVKEEGGINISGDVNGQSEINFTFDFDGNTQGNRTSGTVANVTAIALGLNTGQYVKTNATIGRSNSNTISFVSSVERQYQNA
tara:strand:+ start:2427 stop:3854 length:1428 start_codon:yes stop_codon:yes gene_type:complete